MWRRPKDWGDDTYAANAGAAANRKTGEGLLFIENGTQLSIRKVGKLRVAARTAKRVAFNRL
jgi:hypothetical protein